VLAPTSELPPDFYAAHGAKPLWVAYMLLYLITYALGAILIILRCLQYARYNEVTWLRRSLLLTAAGAAMCLVFCLLRSHSAIYGLLTDNSSSWQPLAPLAAASGQVLIVIGLAGPSFSVLAASIKQRVQVYFWHHQLEPLWTALYEGNSQIALAPPKAPIGNHSYRLYRRIVEIRDGLSAIRPYLPEEASKTSAACQIHSAIQQQQRTPLNTDRGASTKIIGEHSSADRSEELSWLLKVSREHKKLSRVRCAKPTAATRRLLSAAPAAPGQSHE
jgi:hypothetical protein